MNQNELYHHGILGQKWGVRHGPPYPLDPEDHSAREKRLNRFGRSSNKDTTKKKKRFSSTKDVSKYVYDKLEERKQELKSKQSKDQRQNNTSKKKLTKEEKIKIAAGVATAAVLVGACYIGYKTHKLNGGFNKELFDSTKKIDLTRMSDKARVISKDTILQSMSTKPIDDYVERGKNLYASYLKRDNAKYKYIMPDLFKGMPGGNKSFVNNIHLKRDIKIASERDVREAFLNVSQQYYKNTKVSPNIRMDSEAFFRDFISNEVPNRTEMANSFFNTLKEWGYDGIINYNDLNRAESPLLLFDPSDVIEGIGTSELQKLERFISFFKA